MDEAASPISALEKAVSVSGSQSAFARVCGVGQPAICKWLRQGKALPPQHVFRVEQATGVSRHELRPDIYPLAEVPAERTVGGGASIVPCDRRAGMHGIDRA